MSVALRISVFLLLAIGFGVWVSSTYLIEQRRLSTEMADVARVAHINPAIGGLVTELQRERGTSAGFLGAGGNAAFAERLVERRAATNVARVRFDEAIAGLSRNDLDPAFWAAVDVIRTDLEKLADWRGKVDALAVDVAQEVKYYTGIVEPLIGLMSQAAQTQKSGSITRRLLALQALLSAKEKAGLERAMGANGFAAERFPAPILNRFIGLIAQQDAYLGLFRDYAPTTLRTALDEVQTAPVIGEVQTLRRRAIGGDDDGVDAGHWFDLATRRIDLIGGIEAEAYADLQKVADGAATVANQRVRVCASGCGRR